ncbi:MAG: hypothetical protein EOM51_01715 [Clostridia bacterium]|nr:hypothetical protein [Clostridia bacterium]
MTESKEIIKTELQEMARAILCQIFGATEFQNLPLEPEYSASADKMAKSAVNGLEAFDRRGLSFNAEDSIQLKPGSFSEQAEFIPRLKRAEFFEQRIQRRRQRQSPNESFDISSVPFENYKVQSSENLDAMDLSERLSDNFCRDARRYDGAFERY